MNLISCFIHPITHLLGAIASTSTDQVDEQKPIKMYMKKKLILDHEATCNIDTTI